MVKALDSGKEIYSTGIILQELLQGFSDAKAAGAIIDRFSAIPMLIPDTADHISLWIFNIHDNSGR